MTSKEEKQKVVSRFEYALTEIMVNEYGAPDDLSKITCKSESEELEDRRENLKKQALRIRIKHDQ